jgi:hypothetical protein
MAFFSICTSFKLELWKIKQIIIIRVRWKFGVNELILTPSLRKKIQKGNSVYPLNPTAGLGDHFEVTACLPVTISHPQLQLAVKVFHTTIPPIKYYQ